MADVANITFKADTSQVKTAATDLDKLAKSGGYVVKAQDQTAKANAALTKSMSPLITGYQQFIGANEKLRAQQEGISEGAKKTAGSFKLMKGATQQLSYQIQDVAVQAQMGTSAFVILGQQGPQIASVFGPGGAVFGSIIGISAAIAGTLVGAMDAAEKESDDLQSTISELADKFNELTVAQQDLVSLDTKSRMSELKTEVRDLTYEYENLSNKMSIVNFSDDEMAEMAKTLTILSGKISLKSEELDELQATLDGTRGSVADMVSALEDEAAVLGKTARQKALYEAVQKKATAEQIKQINALYDSIEAYESEKAAIKSRSDAAKQAQREIDNQRKVTENLIQTLKRSNDTFGMSRAEIIRYNAAVAASEAPSEALSLSILAEAEALAEKTENLEQATIAQKAMDKAAAESERVADKMQREYERAFESMSDSITDIIMDFKDMGSVATGIATQIARAFIQNQVVNPLLSAAGMQGAPSMSSPLGSLPVGNLANTFAMSSMGQSLGLSSLGGAQLASQYGLTTGVAGASSGLTGAGSLFTSAMPWLAGGLGVIGALAGMFKKPSDKTQSQALNLATGGLTYSGLTDHKFSQQNLDAATAMSSEISALVSVMQSATGTKLTGGVQSTVGGRDGLRVLYSQLGIDTSLSKDMNEAAAEFVISGGDATSVLQQTADQFARITGFDLEPYRSLISSTENIGSNLMAVDQASVFLGKSLDDIRLIFEANTVEGETLAATLQRVVSGVSAAQDEFMGFAYETLGAISNLSGLSESIRDRLLTDEELYDKLEIKAESLAKTIEDMTDPQSITAAVNEIGAIVNRQAGLLDDTQFAAMGNDMAVFLDNVEAAALARTQELVDAKNAELLSMENLTNSSENIAVAAVTFGDHVSRFGEMVSAMQSLISSMSMGREAVTYDS